VAPYGIELRAGSRPCLVFRFDRPIAKATPIVIHGTGTVAVGKIVGSDVSVDLTGVSNRQWLEVGLDEVTAADGGFLPSASIKFAVLAGDVNRNGQITSADISGIQGVMNQPVGVGCFRADVNANGVITSTDVSAVSGQIGALLPQLSF